MNVLTRARQSGWPLRKLRALHAAFPLLTVLASCGGQQSSLNSAGQDASAILTLFWVMLAGAIVLWLVVNGAFYYISRIAPGRFDQRYARHLLIGGGIILPTFVLTALLVWGLSILPDQRQKGDGLVIKVTGEQWWWRVEYWPEGAETPIITANEIRLPVGKRTEFRLTSAQVIHSFWVPALGGKMDMFPGRETLISLAPDKVGTFRGQCAEFCGASHAWMAFSALVMEQEDFDQWLAKEAGNAQPVASEPAARGAAIFDAQGCGACHAIRGTKAVGQVGPDLTHIGSRQSLGAGRSKVTLQDLQTWITHTEFLKPEVKMPSYDLDPADLSDLARYLEGLK